MFLVACGRRLALPQGRLDHARWYPRSGDGRDRVAVHRRDRRLDPHRDGPPAVDRPGLLEDRGRALAERRAATVATSIGVFAVLYAALGVADIVLMRRYARVDPPDARRPPRRRRRAWRSEERDGRSKISGSCDRRPLVGATSRSRGSTSASGCSCRSWRATSATGARCSATIGPHWDGNEVWLVVAAGATFAAFPAWYATMFSGFYLVLVLILVLLVVRCCRWSASSKTPTTGAGSAAGAGGTRSASFGAPFLWGVALANLLHGVPLDGDGDFSGNVLDLFNAYTVAAGVAVDAVGALRGATFLGLRTDGRAARAVARGRAPASLLPAALVVAAFPAHRAVARWRSTATTASSPRC